MIASAFLRLFVYGVPLLLLILGIIAYMGGNLAELIFETSSPMIELGIILVSCSILIFIVIWRFGIR